MRNVVFGSVALLVLGGCAGVSVGVGVGGVSGNVGVGGSATVDLGPSQGGSSGPKILTVSMFKIDTKGVGAEIGTLTLSDSRGGLHIVPKLAGLPAGTHGFHIHENPNCGPAMKDGKMQAGLAAGGHYDPKGTGRHVGPHGDGGHRGDLPVLNVEADGTATQPVNALRLSVNDARGRSFVIHEGGDNFSDQPKPLGGGGARSACGAVSVDWDEVEPREEPK
jgi:Cu-Zn family superoxide dismutase